jgi:hypothetical protein
MTREMQDPTPDEYGGEVHPGWGMIGASRVSATPGAVLFDSDIRHSHYVTVHISTASRKRDLNRDWLHPDQEFVEVAMSEAQWASFVSSMNTGAGVPCTIRRREKDYQVFEFPYEPRLAESMKEVRTAADKITKEIADAFVAYEVHKTVGNLRTLKYAIANAGANMEYAAKSLNEHAENVVQRARADIEAMVTSKAAQLGLEAGQVDMIELTSGEGS